ncbi:MAG: phosphatase PAP2 family protein [Lachnospiraceae bacterium]|nr:phosphatase PAP2 family protein [Lachnospiraceae bacterium]
MDKKIFLYMFGFAEKHEGFKKLLPAASKALTLIIMALYYGAILYLAISLNKKIFPFMLLPYAVLFSVRAWRNKLNRPRPFDELPITPLAAHKSGRSFPSCHSSSAMAIAMAFLYLYTPLGVLTLVLAFLVCLTRVFMGMHYPKDVTVGAGIGIVAGWLFYFVFLKVI